MTLRETLSQAINGRGVTAEIYYDEGPEVEVKIIGNAGYGTQSYWRITGTNSGGDYDTHYIPQTDATSGSFEAEDGHKYALQAVWGNPGISDGAFFTVNFDDDSGSSGDSGNSDSSNFWNNEYYLNVISREGLNISVYRISTFDESIEQGSYVGVLVDGDEIMDGNNIYYRYRIWPYDVFEIKVNLLDGYELISSSVSGLTPDSGAYRFYPEGYSGWVDIYAKVSKTDSNNDNSGSDCADRKILYVDVDGTDFEKYRCYIDTESTTSSYNCEILGQRSFKATKIGTESSILELSDYNITNNACWGDGYADSSSAFVNYLYQLKFKTPKIINNAHKLIIGIKTYGINYIESYHTMQYALSSSDEYYESYLKYSNGYTQDMSLITHGKFEQNASIFEMSNIVIDDIDISPNTIYYLNITDDDRSYCYNLPTRYIGKASEHTVDAIGSDRIIYKYELYQPYIDNGTSWEPL